MTNKYLFWGAIVVVGYLLYRRMNRAPSTPHPTTPSGNPEPMPVMDAPFHRDGPGGMNPDLVSLG